MTSKKSHQPKGRDHILSTLHRLIQTLDVVKDACSIAPAQAVFCSVSILLTMIRDTMANKQDYVDLGFSCADVCQTLERGLGNRRSDELSTSVLSAIGKLTTTVAEIQNQIITRRERNALTRLVHVRDNQDAIATWRQDLSRILHIFNTELLLNNHNILLDLRENALANRQEGTSGRHELVQTSAPLGESPPPPPRACFGRDKLIEQIIDLAEGLDPVALIGPGGIGKTSVALAVLHHDRIKERFSDDRRFIRCDQFPASRTNFLYHFSKIIGAGVENPAGLAPLRSFLASKEMFIILDNAESILDPQGADGQEIYNIVEELSQFDNICFCITSRITTVPPDCKCLDVPTLSIDAAQRTFYRIYDNDQRSGHIDKILRQLDFHPLSVTLLATVARQNKWNNSRLVREWEKHQTGVLRTEHSKSLAVTIELSLASPMFQELGSEAREILGVVAFFPQGVNENNLNWLFPTVPDAITIFNKFCILSLTYRNDDFITMLSPLRDYFCPKNPLGSTLLCTAREQYFARLAVTINPDVPGFEDTRWIVMEDVNFEHLLDVFTSVEPNSYDVWDNCNGFMGHLYWHKPRETVLGPKIEQLPDDHLLKPRGLVELSRLFDSVGKRLEQKRLLTDALKLYRGRGEEPWVASTLRLLAEANRMLEHYQEGIQQAEEALEISERLGGGEEQVWSLVDLARLLFADGQLDKAEEAANRAINILEKGGGFSLCHSHRILGDVSCSRGERDKAIHHYEVALEIASPSSWHDQLFWIHHSMATLFCDEGSFDDANTHIDKAKQYVDHDKYHLGRAMELQARVLYRERKLGDAKSEVSRAVEVFEKLGSAKELERCRSLLQDISNER